MIESQPLADPVADSCEAFQAKTNMPPRVPVLEAVSVALFSATLSAVVYLTEKWAGTFLKNETMAEHAFSGMAEEVACRESGVRRPQTTCRSQHR